MRNMSFSLTTPQFKARTKTITRRLGWKFAGVGDVYCAIEKGQGLKKGEKVVRLGLLRIISKRFEPVNALTRYAECIGEGFPELSPTQFVKMFCKHNGCEPDRIITRLEFEYVEQPKESI